MPGPPKELTADQVAQIEQAYVEGIAEIDREDAGHVLAKEAKARKKAENIIRTHGGLAVFGRQILLLYRLLRDWWDGTYEVPWRTAAAITAALLYFINPFDIVPDFIPVIGYLDDAVVVGACLKLVKSDLRTYAERKGLNFADYGL
jgi:uncharacterized membrane protein YkvA (DUF1232 family)